MIKNANAIFKKFVVVTFLCLGLTSQAHAVLVGSEAAVSFPATGTTGVGVTPFTIGWSFSLDNDRSLTHLGIYNWNNTGQADFDRQIGVWDSLGALVADATLLAGPGGGELDTDPNANFLYVPVASNVMLSAGEVYTVGAWYPGDNSPGIAFEANVSTIDGFNLLTASLVNFSGTFAQPVEDLSGGFPDGFFGPNLRLSTIPVPAAFWLFGTALVGLVGFSKRRKAA